MTTRLERIHQYSQAEPPSGESVELLCEDHCGTYVVPSLCRWIDGKWISDERGTAIAVKVVGWRAPPNYRGR